MNIFFALKGSKLFIIIPYIKANMLISFRYKICAAKVVQVYISKLNTEMIGRLRQLNSPSTETAGRYRKSSDCHTNGYACLIGEKNQYQPLLMLSTSHQPVSFRAVVVMEREPFR